MQKLQSKHLQKKEQIPEKSNQWLSNHPLIRGWLFFADVVSVNAEKEEMQYVLYSFYR